MNAATFRAAFVAAAVVLSVGARPARAEGETTHAADHAAADRAAAEPAAPDHAPSTAQPASKEEHHKSGYLEGPEIVLGLGFTALESYSAGLGLPHFGVAGFIEAPGIEGLFDVELGVRCISAHRAFEVPIDLIFKHSFHLGEIFEPYVGVGPSLVIEREHAETEEIEGTDATKTTQHTFLYAGIAGTAGLYVWARPGYGIYAELDYNCIWKRGVANHEIGATTGFVFRW